MNENGSAGRGSVWKLVVAALGVVYGDIGTSPLYSFRICFSTHHSPAITPDNVLGVLSLIFWALVILTSIEYMALILRADHKREGGILSLVTLLRNSPNIPAKQGAALLIIGLVGASLLYGDSLITPVISVLSAVEGLKIATSVFNPYILPISAVILLGLFSLQRFGSTKVGSLFGPVMIIWFIVLAILGIASVVRLPQVLAAVNPYYAIKFIATNKLIAFFTLGSVFLTLTGAEALYADMGHFGKSPIRRGWFFLVFPALLLNYFGQGAVLLSNPAMIDNLFYRLAPAWAVVPLVILATIATVIASQAVISGAFSLTKQAIQLGYCPRLDIRHTSSDAIGQIYIPTINWLLFVGSTILIFGFRASDNLAGAYGVAVSLTMLITTSMMFLVYSRIWKWPVLLALPLTLCFAIFDFSFFTSNLTKVFAGGWLTICIALTVFTLMLVWNRGRNTLNRAVQAENLPEEYLLQSFETETPVRVPGTAVFLTGNSQGIPRTFLHNYKHNKVIHETVVLLTVVTEEVPSVEPESRIRYRALGYGFHRIEVRFGFLEDQNLLPALEHPDLQDKHIDFATATFFMGRETLVLAKHKDMPFWQKRVYSFLARNAHDASKYFSIPPGRVVELGIQFEI
jgi:KUP system potassium uptake protein